MLRFSSLALAIPLAFFSSATIGAGPLDKLSGDEINRLPQAQLDLLPVIEAFAKVAEAQNPPKPRALVIRTWTLLIEDLLYELRFYPHLPKGHESPELAQAVKDFQRSISAKETGILLFGEYDKLAGNAFTTLRPNFFPRGGSVFSNVPEVWQYGGAYF